jgi:hypothetical protein
MDTFVVKEQEWQILRKAQFEKAPFEWPLGLDHFCPLLHLVKKSMRPFLNLHTTLVGPPSRAFCIFIFFNMS